MTQPQDKMRAEFEAWAEPDYPIRRGFGKQNDYDFVEVRRMWNAWQAACAQQSAQSQQDALDADGHIAAWMTEDGERVVSAATMAGARKDGGAILSSMKPYSVALIRAATQGASNV